MSDTKQARLVERWRDAIDGNVGEIWDIEDGRGIYVHFNVCPFDTRTPETMAFPYDLARRMVTDWKELGCLLEDATGGRAMRELGYEPVEEDEHATE